MPAPDSPLVLPYTEDEICGLYRGARDGKAQVRIIAQLCVCDTATIREILERHGMEAPKLSRVASYSTPRAFTAEDIERIEQMAAKGMKGRDIAEVFGITPHTFYARIRNLGIRFSCHWTENQIDELMSMYDSNIAPKEIAKHFGRRTNSVVQCYHYYKRKREVEKERIKDKEHGVQMQT